VIFKNVEINDVGIRDIEVKDIEQNKSELTLIDVRRPDEYVGELGHVKGIKLLTLENEFKEKIKDFDKDKPIAFICRSGGRSTQAALYARDLGFQEVYNMKGGMIEWNNQKLPIDQD